MLADQTAAFCAEHPNEHATHAFVPRDWTRGMYFMDDWDPRFGDAFYDGSWIFGSASSLAYQLDASLLQLVINVVGGV